MKREKFSDIFAICILMISLCGCTEGKLLQEKLQTAVLEKKLALVQKTEDDENEQTPDFLYEGTGCFARQGLNETEELWYCEIADCLGTMKEEVRLDSAGIEEGMDEADVDRIFQCVLMDHPELFYVEGYTYQKYTRGENVVALQFSGTYGMKPEEAENRRREIEAKTQVLLAGAAGLTDDYDKVKYVYETVIRQTEYDLEAEDNQNIYSVFVNHKSVCHGYAKAVQYLLERLGVECGLVLGTVDTGEGHAWNLVRVNGSCYYVDATWGDASYQNSGDKMSDVYVPEISYDYLCITTEQLLRTHILCSYVPMPLCVELADNYYVREGAYFTAYDKAQMQEIFQHSYEQGRKEVSVKCSDAACFAEIRTAMVEEQEIFNYLKSDSSSIVYAENEKQLSMTFWVTNE